MQPRQLLIVAIAVIVAFGAAFGIAKAGAGKEPDGGAGAAKPAEVIEVGDATVAASVSDAGGLPALQLPEKKKKQPETAGGDSSATTTGPVATPTPSTTTTTTTSPSSSGSTGTTQSPSGGTNPPVSTGGGGD